MSKRQFIENYDGVHLMSAINDEYTICGMAFDSEYGVEGDGDFTQTSSTVVTCKSCIEEIMNCRGVKMKGQRDESSV